MRMPGAASATTVGSKNRPPRACGLPPVGLAVHRDQIRHSSGGDHAMMLKSLARTLTLPDRTVVLPGHGPQTTIGAERRTNPFLTGLQPANRGL